MLSLAQFEDDHEEGMVDKLSKAGRISDPEALEDAAKLLALRVVQGIGDKVLAVIVLIVALIAVRRMDRNRVPQPRREKSVMLFETPQNTKLRHEWKHHITCRFVKKMDRELNGREPVERPHR